VGELRSFNGNAEIAGLDIDELNLNGKISFLEKIFTPSPEKQS